MPRTLLHTITSSRREFQVCRATSCDVPAIVELLADDVLGRDREGGDAATYLAAFERLDTDPANLLVIVLDEADAAVATVHLTLLPGLSRDGATRLQVEAVRVAASTRGTGLGSALLTWVADWGRSQGATVAQLTTDRRRDDAQRFYARLGWQPTHVGMKLPL